MTPAVRRATTLVSIALALAAPLAYSQAYPTKPIRMIIPLPPGTATDLVARIIGGAMAQSLGQTIVMDNRSGADGSIAGSETVKATPDGYTIMFGTNSPLSAVPAMRSKPPYNTLTDFTPIGFAGRYTHYVVVHPSLPVKSLAELIEYARANPGKVSYGTGNTFGILTIAQLQKVANVKLTHIPYKGDPAALIDVVAGRIQFMYATRGQSESFVREGKLRAIAVTGSKRFDNAPDIPTVAESGLQVPVLGWAAVVGPARMPSAVVERLNRDLNAVLVQPRIVDEVGRQGFEPGGSTTKELATFLRQQHEFWGSMAKELGLQTF